MIERSVIEAFSFVGNVAAYVRWLRTGGKQPTIPPEHAEAARQIYEEWWRR